MAFVCADENPRHRPLLCCFALMETCGNLRDVSDCDLVFVDLRTRREYFYKIDKPKICNG